MLEKRTFVKVTSLAVLLGAFLIFVSWFRFSNSGAEFLWGASQGGKLLLPLVGVSAMIDSINPCAFSILLVTVAFLLSMGTVRRNIIKIGGVYIAGIFLVYILIGLGILKTLHIFNTPHFMAKAGAVFLIVLGALNLVNYFFPRFPLKLRIPHSLHSRMAALLDRASLPAAFSLGALVGLCEFPCTGGPYLMVLGLLHDSATYYQGFGYLILYNLIFILPLIIMLFMASDRAVLEKLEKWKREKFGALRLSGGIAMVLLGALIFTL